MASLNDGRIVARELDVTVVVGAFHLPGIDTKLAHSARIASGT
ncbi:Uncharacterised protein [Salmonella enterica subsp. enterica serovar Bovismorbificans]|uniref:Uncharacterized protein n=1 Tax=Salmonella enterica subsp. enterica serovar Bovismorbificans TaxID=58097 RepID=A0A655C9D7_SALET|nr:Uncharacterised protein [Salmonella enterica subsp. enterica serovar Bovismorbificans]